MAAYIRLPRDSSEASRPPSPITSSPTPISVQRRCLRLNHSQLRALGSILSLVAVGITASFIDMAAGPNSGAAVPLLFACVLSTALNGSIGLWAVVNWALSKWSRCEKCRHKASNYPAGPWIALIVIDGFIAFMTFVCSIVQLVEPGRFGWWKQTSLLDLTRASGAFGLILFFLHAFFVVCDLLQKVRIEVTFLDGQEEDGALRRDEMVEDDFGRVASVEAQSLKPSEHVGSDA